MNLIILTAQFLILYVGIFVNSQLAPEEYEDVSLKTYVIKEGKLFRPVKSLYTNTQVAFSAWKQGNKMSPGNYTLYLVSPGDFKLNLGKFEYKVQKHSSWVNIPDIKWVNIPVDDISQFRLYLKSNNPSTRRSVFGNVLSMPYQAENWMFRIHVKELNLFKHWWMPLKNVFGR